MEVFGMPITAMYLFILVSGVFLTFLYIFVGELLEGLFDIAGDGIVNPITIIGFITLFGGLGYIGEVLGLVSSGLLIIVNLLLSAVIIVLVNFYIILPLKRTEKSMSSSIQDLKGRVGEVYTSIPADGFGEVIIRRTHGTVSKPAKSFDGEPLKEGRFVLIVDIDEEGVLLVSEYEV
ncbi:hypothetical protein [Alkalicoccus daliensis]|uniref:Membrane protein NfeD2 N-terminal transmembrane domain-containing protein n=1 Tax=Alkalicoccus daliensis TaxID=745820 RepID=A0A1H0J2Q9_9BACI|nr:hypothetical protein [Alkalicoccus daliensis]SDO38034.1 hypothetical protein SAMN04488053_11250 [Alkalicoccus daliensis]